MYNTYYQSQLDFLNNNLSLIPAEQFENVNALLSTPADYPDLDDQEYEEMLQSSAIILYNDVVVKGEPLYSYEYISAVMAICYYRTKDASDNWGDITYFGNDDLWSKNSDLYRQQRIAKGFDNTDTWGFDDLIVKWLDVTQSVPASVKEAITYILEDQVNAELTVQEINSCYEEITTYLETKVDLLAFAKFIQPRLNDFIIRDAFRGVPSAYMLDENDFEGEFKRWKQHISLINSELELYVKTQEQALVEPLRDAMKYLMMLTD